MKDIKYKGKLLAIILGLVQLFIGFGGISGGILLVIDPSGAKIGFELSLLTGTPFSDFFIPGLFLLLFNGIFVLLAAVASFKKYRYAGEIGIFFGVGLLVFMVAEIIWIGLVMWLQHLFLIIAVIEIFIGFFIWKFRLLKSDQA